MQLARHKLALQCLVEVTGAERGRIKESQGYVKWYFFSISEKTIRVSHHPVNADKVFRFLGPGRELHVAHGDTIVTHSELVLVTVDEHLRQVVELWDQLLMDTTNTYCLTKRSLIANYNLFS